MKAQIILAILVASALCEGLNYDNTDVDTNVEVQTFPSFDPNFLQRSTGNAQQTNANIQNAISNAQRTNLTPTRSIDSLFSRLPSTNELDEIILSADSIAILKTIQTLVSNDAIPCDQIVSYLLEMLGRIRAAIQKKQFAADQLRIIIDGAKAEIARIDAEIARLQQERKDLWLDELKAKLADLVAQLEPLYKQFNEVESQIAPNEARVAGYEKEISILQNANNEERNRIANDRLKLTETEARIRDLQNQLNAARDTQAALQASIAKSQALIAANDKKIADARAAIDQLEATIRRLRDQADAIRAKITELEIRVERVRTDISVALAKDDQFAKQIADLKARRAVEESKLVDKDLDSLLEMVATLTRILPSVQMEIDRQYYYCYGEGAVQTTNTGGVLVYVVRGESFAKYLQSAYGQDVRVVQGGVRAADYQFYSTDIFSPLWTSTFGYPFVAQDFNTADNSFASDFGCLNPSALQSGQGVIKSVQGNHVQVTNSAGSNISLNLGACSRIESATKVPRPGQNAVFKGVPSTAGGYNVYALTCW